MHNRTLQAVTLTFCGWLLQSVLPFLLAICAVTPRHAELEQKGKQVFLKALQGELVFDR